MVWITNSHFTNLHGVFYTAAMSSLAHRIFVFNCTFIDLKGKVFNFTNETTNKGLYNVENLKISNSRFFYCSGQILTMLRGGNDESTMGPYVVLRNNIIDKCSTTNGDALIHLFGTQRAEMKNNIF